MAARGSSQYHPSYASKDGDLVLSSSDGVLFNVHSEVLRRASGFFKDMYNMPRSADDRPGPLIAKAGTVAAALDIIYPDRGYPKFTSLADVRHLLSFGEYYSIPKVGSHAHALIQANLRLPPHVLGGNPVELYMLCCQFGFEEEAVLASAETLQLNLRSGSYDAILKELSGKDLLRLMRLHQGRRDAVLNAILLNPRDFFETADCLILDNYFVLEKGLHDFPKSWPTLTQIIYEVVEKEPVDCVLRNRTFLDRPELETLWSVCTTCNKSVCSKEKFWLCLQGILDRAPKTV